ncbi:hypothetical protein ABPG72_020673 [Tetrahymena utriculariae]
MALSPVVKYIIAFLTCGCWCPFYMFLNAYIRTCNMCFETISKGKNTLMKILACLFFCFCFGIIECIFCVFGIVYLFEGPCNSFVNNSDFRKGYIALVSGDNFPIESTVKGAIQGIFC